MIEVKFQNEADYVKARDLHIEILEKTGWTPKPTLSMFIRDEVADEFKQRIEAEAIPYREGPEFHQ